MAADIAGDNGNGKVTMAVLGQKLDEVIRRLDKMERCMDESEARMRQIEQGASSREARLHQIEGDVERLQSKDTFGSIVTGLLAAIGIYLGSR